MKGLNECYYNEITKYPEKEAVYSHRVKEHQSLQGLNLKNIQAVESQALKEYKTKRTHNFFCPTLHLRFCRLDFLTNKSVSDVTE